MAKVEQKYQLNEGFLIDGASQNEYKAYLIFELNNIANELAELNQHKRKEIAMRWEKE